MFILHGDFSKQRKITMQDKHLCWPPYFFLGPGVAPHFLSSRIATACNKNWSCALCMCRIFYFLSSQGNRDFWQSRFAEDANRSRKYSVLEYSGCKAMLDWDKDR